MLTEITTEWNHKYDTHTSAKPEPGQERRAEHVLAIRITNGHLRGSDFDGVFELANVQQPFDNHGKNGQLRVEVKVGWFGMKPKTTWSHITLNGPWELIPNYSRMVVHNLAA
jgi:hypothetical protein